MSVPSARTPDRYLDAREDARRRARRAARRDATRRRDAREFAIRERRVARRDAKTARDATRKRKTFIRARRRRARIERRATMASTSTARDAVTCEIKIDPATIARAVSHATKHIAREPEDAYEFPGRERDGERGGDAGETTTRRGTAARDDAEARRETMERDAGEGRATSGMGEVNARRGRDRETSSGETGEVTMRSRGDERGGRTARKAGEDADADEPYVRFEDLFGAKALFAKSNSRARGIQADMYIQDYLERKVYGYAHVSVKRKSRKKEVVMERRVVGVGRPEDALDFAADENPACAARHPPLQSLPPAFSLARGDAIKASEFLEPPTWIQRRGDLEAVAAATATKLSALSRKESTADFKKAKKTPTVAEVAERATTPIRPLKRAAEVLAAKGLKATPSPDRQKTPNPAPGMSPFSALKMPGTIFDSSDFLGDAHDDMLFWDALNDIDHPTHAATHRTTSAMPSKRRKAREATRSPSVRSDATGSPKSEAKLTAVEKRLRDLEAKLSRGEYHVSERVGAADAVPATRPMTFDDTARAEASGKKRTLSGGSDERENATSVREQSTQSELQRLNDTILALVQRQDKYEIERHRHQKQMYELCQTHKEHTASLESIIAAYEKRFSAISPQTPRKWDGPPLSIPPRFARDEPALSTPLEEFHAPRDDPRAYNSAGPAWGRSSPTERFDRSFHDQAPYSENKRNERSRDVEAILEREMRFLQESLARKNEVIASLASELGSAKQKHTKSRWDSVGLN